MRPIGERQPGQKTGAQGHAIRQLQRRPAPATSDPIWAMASASSQAMNDDGAYYTVTFDGLYSNSDTAFTENTVSGGRFTWVQLNEPGYYVLKAALYLSSEYNAIFTRLDPMFSLGGAAARMQANFGQADFIGILYNRASEQDAGENAHPGYYTEMTFNWNPASPQSSFDFENPLKVGLTFALAGGPATMSHIGAELFLTRLADEGYTVLYP